MFASKTARGFFDTTIHGNNMPADVVEITADEYNTLLEGQSQGKLIDFDETGYPFLVIPPPYIPQVPTKVTMRQARLALHSTGNLAAVEAAINALPEPPRTAARIEWDYSSEVHRDKEFVALMGQSLNLTEEDLDNLFTLAATL